MKASFFGLFSAVVCLLTTLVVASPMVVDTRDVVALDTRDTTALDARDVEVSIDIYINIAIAAITDCNNRYITHCGQYACTQDTFVEWSVEISIYVDACVTSINAYVAAGGTYTDVEYNSYYELIVQVFIDINIGIDYMGNNCNLGGGGGLLGGLLSTVLGLVYSVLDSLCYDFTNAILDLGICLDIDIYVLISGLDYSGSECYLCNYVATR